MSNSWQTFEKLLETSALARNLAKKNSFIGAVRNFSTYCFSEGSSVGAFNM